MGATLDYESTTASDWKEARDKVVEYCTSYYGTDPYNGTLSTITDWSYCRKSFDNVDDFIEWVEDNGSKWEAYVWEHGGTYHLCGWCAC
jgi:hypothetical protein